MSHYSVDFITHCVWYIIFAFLPTRTREKGAIVHRTLIFITYSRVHL